MSRTTSEYQHLATIRHHLLVWAGYHRGTSLLEDAMPRFHEIIDEMSTLVPEMIIVQGGTCWACGEPGADMTWWHTAIYNDQEKVIGNQRMSYLIHKGCKEHAEQKVTKAWFHDHEECETKEREN